MDNNLISIGMATYNGEKYIEEQLDCIYHQTRKPDEVIICDDGSGDQTVTIIRDYIDRNNLSDSWHLYINEENKGYPGNFYYVMELCTGRFVFLADQDDIWHEKKLEEMFQILVKSPEIDILACKFGLVDSEGQNIHSVMAPSKSLGTKELRVVSMKDAFGKYQWPGMVMAYRREWYERSCKAPQNCKVAHDFWLCIHAAEEGTMLWLDEELAWHRRHDNNTAREEHRVRQVLLLARKLGDIDQYIEMLRGVKNYGNLKTPEGKQALGKKLQSMEDRREALCSGSTIKVLKNGIKNRKYVRLATLLCDLAIVKQKDS